MIAPRSVALILALTACAAMAHAQALTGTRWEIASIRDEGKTIAIPPADRRLTSFFVHPHKQEFSAMAACVAQSGGYLLRGNILRLGPIKAALANCPDDFIARDYALGRALSAVTGYRSTRSGVELLNGGGETIIILVPPAKAAR